MKFRQSLLSYAEKHEVTQAAIKYNVNTPHRGITGTGLTGNDLDGVLAVKHIVDAVAAAHLDRVDLVDVKFFQCLTDMIFGQRPLVLLIGNQISDNRFQNKNLFFSHIPPTEFQEACQ